MATANLELGGSEEKEARNQSAPSAKRKKKREQERKMIKEAQFNIDLLNSYRVPDPGQDAGNTNTVMIISVSEELQVKFQKKATC